MKDIKNKQFTFESGQKGTKRTKKSYPWVCWTFSVLLGPFGPISKVSFSFQFLVLSKLLEKLTTESPAEFSEWLTFDFFEFFLFSKFLVFSS